VGAPLSAQHVWQADLQIRSLSVSESGSHLIAKVAVISEVGDALAVRVEIMLPVGVGIVEVGAGCAPGPSAPGVPSLRARVICTVGTLSPRVIREFSVTTTQPPAGMASRFGAMAMSDTPDPKPGKQFRRAGDSARQLGQHPPKENRPMVKGFRCLSWAPVVCSLLLALFPDPSRAQGAPATGFVPGSRTIFALDLAGAPQGDVPRQLKLLKGGPTMVMKDGAPMLKAPNVSEFLIALPSSFPTISPWNSRSFRRAAATRRTWPSKEPARSIRAPRPRESPGTRMTQ
jgi:hypothetical protein